MKLLRQNRAAVLVICVFGYFMAAAYHTAVNLPDALGGATITTASIGVETLAAIILGLYLREQLGPDPSELPAAALVALFVSLPVTRVPHDRNLLYLTLGATAAITFCGVSARQTSWRVPRATVFVLALFTSIAIASLYSPDVGAVKSLAAVAVPSMAAFLLGGTLDPVSTIRTARIVVLLALLEALLALVELAGVTGSIWATAGLTVNGKVVPYHNSLLPGHLVRSQGTFGSPLPLGVLLLVAVALVVRLPGRASTAARSALAAVLVGGLIASGDRSCLLGAFAILLVWPRTTILRAVAGLLAASTVAALLVATGRLDGTIFTNFFASGDFLHRISAISSIHKLIDGQNRWRILFGNGFSSTQRIFDRGLLQTDGFDVVDNQMVLLLSQAGLVAVGSFAILLGLAIRSSRSWLRLAVLAAVVAQFVFDALTWPSTAVIVLLILGMALHQESVAAGATDGARTRASDSFPAGDLAPAR